MNVQLTLDAVDIPEMDAGLAVIGSGNDREPTPQALEDSLRTAMSQGFLTNAWRRRRAYPVTDLAERQVRHGDFDAAIATYTHYLEEDPQHAVVRWRLIQLLRLRGRENEVVANADALLGTAPKFGLAIVERAEALASLGQTGPAMDGFARALNQPGVPLSGRRRALAGLVATALASGQVAVAERLLQAEPAGEPGSVTGRALLAARATLAERAGRPSDAAALWARLGEAAPPAERRRALLAQAQLLEQAGRPLDGLNLLQGQPARSLLSQDGNAPFPMRLRYARLVSVLAEQSGQVEIAAEAAATAAALARSDGETRAGRAEQGLTDRLRAARLTQRRPDASPLDALAFLADADHALGRPAGVADAAWADYLLLLAETAQRAGRTALADEAVGQLSPMASLGWRDAARAAEIAARAGRPAQAAAYWGRAAAAAQDPRERRSAILSQAQLLEAAGATAEALAVLREEPVRLMFEEGQNTASPGDRLRYERLVSVLAERTGQPDLARQAAEQAASLQTAGPERPSSAQALVDRLRATRLRTGPDGQPSAAALPQLLDAKQRPLARPDDADDALWTEYVLLLGELGARAHQPATVRGALEQVPAASLRNWRVAARVGELALESGQTALALTALRQWDASALAAAGADRQATLTVLNLRANAAAGARERGLEGTTAAEIEAIDPRIGNPMDRAQRLLAAHDPDGAVAMLTAARAALQARLGAGEQNTRHDLAQLLLTLADAERQAGRPAQAAAAVRDSLRAEETWDARWAIAEALRRSRDRQGAAAEYRRAAQLARTPAEAQLAWLTLGDLLWEAKSDAAAYDAFRSAVAAGSGAPARSRLAEAADRLGRYADAARAIEPLAGSVHWRERLCRTWLKAQDEQEASRCLAALVAMAGRDATAWRTAGDIAGALGRLEDQAHYMKTAFGLTSQPELGLAAGDSLMRAGQAAEAAAMFEAVAARTGDPGALVARGEALLAAHQPGAAADALQSALARSDLSADLQVRAYASLGFAKAADGDALGAVAAWLGALRLRPDAELSIAAADALLGANRPNEAARVLAEMGQEDAGALAPQRKALEVRLAIARGDAASALAGAEELVRADPTPANLGVLAQARSAAGDKAGAAEVLVRLADAVPGDVQAQAQAGYAELNAGKPAEAARRFEAALAREPDRLPLRQDLPRAYALSGEWPDARRAYAEAIRRTTAHEAATGDPGDAQRLHDLRRENAAATREFAFELVDTLCLPKNAVGCGLSLPIIERLGSAGIGAATFGWSPHLPGDPDPQRLSVYVRMLWANDPGSFSLLGRTLQGGVGVRWHPVSSIPVYLWAERLFAVGRTSQDNWLLRVTAGWASGADWKAGGGRDWRRDWTPYVSIYGDLGKFFIRDRDWLGVIEGRAGASHQPLEQLMLTPYAFLRGELDSARTGTAQSLQIGAGLSVRTRFHHDPLTGYQVEPEFFARVSHDLSRTGGRTASRFIFGVIARF